MFMKRILAMTAAVVVVCGSLAAASYAKTAEFAAFLSENVSQAATDYLGVKVEVGDVRFASFRSIEADNIKVYDKQAEIIAAVDRATVDVSPLAALKSPAAAVDKVTVAGVAAFISEREDGTFNFNDAIPETEGESEFSGKIEVTDATITGRARGAELVLRDASATVDCADPKMPRINARGKNFNADIEAFAGIGETTQIINAKIKNIDTAQYFSLIPEGTLPDSVEPLGGTINEFTVNVLNKNDVLSFSGTTAYENLSAKIEATTVEGVTGFATFTDAEVFLSSDAEADGQKAHAQGSIDLRSADPVMNLNVSATDFAPQAVLAAIPLNGTVDFSAHVTGTFKNPGVDGQFSVAHGETEGIVFDNASCRARLADNLLSVQDLKADVFDGKVTGEGELSLEDFSFAAHVLPQGINASHAADFVPQAADFRGFVDGDLAVNGNLNDIAATNIYGSASVKSAAFRELPINSIGTSFFVKNGDLFVDYLSIKMPNHSDIGIEGSLTGGDNVDFNIYGGHVDFAAAKKFAPDIDVEGFGDFQGSIKGNIANPQTDLKFVALRGRAFEQTFDSVKGEFSGNLDELNVKEIIVEKDGKDIWDIAGSVGLTGEKRIDLRADTMGVRCEELPRINPSPATWTIQSGSRVRLTIPMP